MLDLTSIKFSELAPAHIDTEERVGLFYKISDIERTFGNKVIEATAISATQGSTSHTTGMKRAASPFVLDDIDSMVNTKIVNKEASSVPVPKSNPPTTRGKTSAKKKKTNDSTESVMLTDLDPHEALKAINQGSETLMKAYEELVKENADMSRRLIELSRKYDEMKLAVTTDKTLLQQKLKDLDAMTKKMHTLEADHAKGIEDLLTGAKRSAALTVYQARLKMVEEINDPAFDRSKWDVEGWKRVILELDGSADAEVDKAGGSGVDKETEEEVAAEVNDVQGGEDVPGFQDEAVKKT